MRTEGVKVQICIPSGEHWTAGFGISLAMLMADLARPFPAPGVQQVSVRNVKGSILAKSRQLLVEQALREDADFILFIDSDQIFPPILLRHMLSLNRMVVAANVPVKTIPSNPTARAYNNDYEGRPVYTTLKNGGLEQVWRVGCGVMCINTRVFNKLKSPYFLVDWDEKANAFIGEDWYFCSKLQAAGIPVFVDHDISKTIGHIGEFVYDHSLVDVKESESKLELVKQ